MLRIKKILGQSTAEYAILIGVVIAALIAMQTFVGRGIKAKVHGATLYRDAEIDTLAPGEFTTNEWEPGIAGSTETTRDSAYNEQMSSQGAYSRTDIEEVTGSTGNRIVPGYTP